MGNDSFKNKMNFRDRLKKKLSETQIMSNWNEFRKAKNQVNQKIKAAKMAYYNNTAFYKYAGDLLRHRRNIIVLPSSSEKPGGCILDIPQSLNLFFRKARRKGIIIIKLRGYKCMDRNLTMFE